MTPRVTPRSRRIVGALVVALACCLPAAAQWVHFVDDTMNRLTAAPALVGSDPEEKDYAWGDVDKDGDIDLVIVRKEPFTSPGKKTNVLLLNENGVLVDRTMDFASSSDVPGDMGFMTPTNDRDVQLVDVDNDTFLDIVTAVTISDGDPKHIGHPRIYMNLGLDGMGDWLGFQHQDARIPTMLSFTGNPNQNPRFCSVAVGDVTGDGFVDLWFGDYDSSGAGGFDQPAGADFNDRLLVNDGTGHFADLTQARFLGQISIPNSGNEDFEVSAFGAAGVIADMDSDGFEDIVKQTSLNAPLYVGIAYNDSANEGFFDTYEVVNNQAPYFISVGDLNNDSKLDIVITDDGADRYLINQGNGMDGLADFVTLPFSFDQASDDGFGSNSVISDLNNDGFDDVLIADVDVDIAGCGRRMHIYRNLGGSPGSNVTLQEQTTGTNCATNDGNPPSCLVASIPADMLTGVHDVAVFDLDGDGWKDLIVGRCSSTEIYINQPPTGLVFTYPQGLPAFLPPGQATTFQVQVVEIGATVHAAGTGMQTVKLGGGSPVTSAMTQLGPNLYEATIPAATCPDTVEFYFSADDTTATTFFDPPTAPTDTFQAVSAVGKQVIFEDGMEGDVSGWTVVNDGSLTSGAWEQAVPEGTIGGGGEQAAPDEDAEASTALTKAFVTQNGPPGGAAADDDVDGGPTDLISPAIDMSGTDGTITYSRWFYTSTDDDLTVWVTDDGVNWVLVETITGIQNSWTVSSFRVSDFITPSANVQVRFRTSDNPNNSLTEAAIDLFRVEIFVCVPCTGPGDCDDNVFCNGAETCSAGICTAGTDPCVGLVCDEANDTCEQCLDNADCDDGLFCNGAETCQGNACLPGRDPCPGQFCGEFSDVCATCLVDQDCDDGVFCNGAEICFGGTCSSGPPACPGQGCDELGQVCVGAVPLQERMGQPYSTLTGLELDRFQQGKTAFERNFSETEGLGPVFNQTSCAACHSVPVGGSGSIAVTRFGMDDPKGGGFDPLVSFGGSLLQSQAISPMCMETIHPSANVTAQRITPSTLGFGLVEAIDDADIQANATNPPAGISGEVHIVPVLENPPATKVGRFGWKAQVATVLSFSGDASLNEMGITNRLVTTENAPNGDAMLLAQCDTVPDIEDGPDVEGFDFIDRVTDFQRFLAPPPQTPRSGMTGETVFNNVNCNACHISSFQTPDDPSLEDSLRDRILKPYSDFLLHDMGLNADFIEQGGAAAGDLRTTPLWGLRVRDPMWHDGRISGGTFESRVLAAIAEHNSLGSEARNSVLTFNFQSPANKDALVVFLDSLGRAEFDGDGDGDVDSDDFADFNACFTGPGNFYNANDPCAVHDVDQDGDVDDDDETLFIVAATGVAGRVPDGMRPSNPLRVETDGVNLTLTWDSSCMTGDQDYNIYEGDIGNYASHTMLVCSTGGATMTTIGRPVGSKYYLVVPTNGFREGSYGLDYNGERPAGVATCLPQSIGSCP